MMTRKIVKIVLYSWEDDTRDQRELSVCRELGLEPVVIAKGNVEDWGREGEEAGFRVLHYSTRPLGTKMPKPVSWLATMVSWAYVVHKMKPAIISGHDIIALTIGWMSTIGVATGKKPKLVYDSHEFELGRNANRSKLHLFMIKYLERFMMKRCAFSIMVNDAIADEVQAIHNLQNRPVVVRNIPERWTIEPDVCNLTRQKLMNAMENPKEMLLMYHGEIIKGRGVEMLLKLIHKNEKICMVILGSGESVYLNELKKMAADLGVTDRVMFHSAVPFAALRNYVGAADLGMVTIPAVAKSYYYMLPNKFFENIQSETPIICSNFPAVAPIIEQYHIGLTCDPTDLAEINACVEKMRTDRAFYASCKENLKLAKQDLCWEEEKRILLRAYKETIDSCCM